MSVLSFLGVLYILNVLNKNMYKILPDINISDFFIRKLEIKEITSVVEYIMARIKLYRGLKNIGNINENDLSEFDADSLCELKQYINNELRQYIKKATQQASMFDQTDSHIQCTMNHGILDFYLSQNTFFDMKIKFQSFSQDCPCLEISTKAITYTYKIKSKYIRFVNPNIKSIYEIRNILKTFGNNEFSLQSAA